MSGADIGTNAGSVPVEIIQTVARKRWPSAQKLRMVEESMKPGNSVSRIARQNGISPALLYKWRKLMLEGGATAAEHAARPSRSGSWLGFSCSSNWKI